MWSVSDISMPPGGALGLGQLCGTHDGGTDETGYGAALRIIRQGGYDLQTDCGSEHYDVDQPCHCVVAAGEGDRDRADRAVDSDLCVPGHGRGPGACPGKVMTLSGSLGGGLAVGDVDHRGGATNSTNEVVSATRCGG